MWLLVRLVRLLVLVQLGLLVLWLRLGLLLVLRHLGAQVQGRGTFARLHRHSGRAYACRGVVVWLHEHMGLLLLLLLLLLGEMGVVVGHDGPVLLGKGQIHGHVVLVHELLAVLLDLCSAVLEPVLQPC